MTSPTTETVAYRWRLRKVMSEAGLHNTTDLVPLLADRGVVMTSTQVYRIVTGEPERLNMRLLAALCDIFGCTPNDLIEPYVVATSGRGRKTAAVAAPTGSPNPASKNRPDAPPSPTPTTPDPERRCQPGRHSRAPSAAGRAAAEHRAC